MRCACRYTVGVPVKEMAFSCQSLRISCVLSFFVIFVKFSYGFLFCSISICFLTDLRLSFLISNGFLTYSGTVCTAGMRAQACMHAYVCVRACVHARSKTQTHRQTEAERVGGSGAV